MKYLKIRNIEKLNALKLSNELLERVGEIVESLPMDEEHIRDQLLRATISISHNICRAEQIYPKTKKIVTPT